MMMMISTIFINIFAHVVLLVVVAVVRNNLFSGWNREVVLYLYLFRKRLHSLLNIIVVVVDLYSGGSVLFYSCQLAPVMSGSVFEVFRMGWRYKRTTSRGRRRD